MGPKELTAVSRQWKSEKVTRQGQGTVGLMSGGWERPGVAPHGPGEHSPRAGGSAL